MPPRSVACGAATRIGARPSSGSSLRCGARAHALTAALGGVSSSASYLPAHLVAVPVSERALRGAVPHLTPDEDSLPERQRTELLHQFLEELKRMIKERSDLPWRLDRACLTGSAARSTAATASNSDRDIVLFLHPRRQAILADEGSDAWAQEWLRLVGREACGQLQGVVRDTCARLQAQGGLVATVGIQTSFGDDWYNWCRITIGSPQAPNQPYVQVGHTSCGAHGSMHGLHGGTPKARRQEARRQPSPACVRHHAASCRIMRRKCQRASTPHTHD